MVIAKLGGLDFSDQIERRYQRLSAGRPFGRTDLSWVSRDVLCCLNFAQQLCRVTTDAVVMNFGDFDLAFWIDDEGAA